MWSDGAFLALVFAVALLGGVLGGVLGWRAARAYYSLVARAATRHALRSGKALYHAKE